MYALTCKRDIGINWEQFWPSQWPTLCSKKMTCSGAALYVFPKADEDKAFNIYFFSLFLYHTLWKWNAGWNWSVDLWCAAVVCLWEHKVVLQVGKDSVGIKWLKWSKPERTKSEGNSISWRSSQQAPQWAGLAWRQSACLLQAPAVWMCKYGTYVWTALIFIHCAGVNPCKGNVGATGSAAIKHFLGCAVCLQSPLAVRAVGCREGDLQALPCFQPVCNKGRREHPTWLSTPAHIHCCCVCRLVRERKQPEMAVERNCSACWLTPCEILDLPVIVSYECVHFKTVHYNKKIFVNHNGNIL